MVNIIKDDNQTYYGDHFVMYAIESLFYITDINIMLCQLHFNKEKKLQQISEQVLLQILLISLTNYKQLSP